MVATLRISHHCKTDSVMCTIGAHAVHKSSLTIRAGFGGATAQDFKKNAHCRIRSFGTAE